MFDIVQILGQRLSSKQLSQQYGGLQVAAVSPIQLSQSIVHALNIIYALYITLVSNSGGTIVDVAKTTAVAAKVIFEKINGLDKETLPTSHSTPLHMLPSEGEKMAKKVRLVSFILVSMAVCRLFIHNINSLKLYHLLVIVYLIFHLVKNTFYNNDVMDNLQHHFGKRLHYLLITVVIVGVPY